MNGRGGGGGRHYPRGGGVDIHPPRRNRFRGQYFRRRTPSGGGYRAGGSFSDDRNDSSPPPPPSHLNNQQQQQQQQSSSSYMMSHEDQSFGAPPPPPPPSHHNNHPNNRAQRMPNNRHGPRHHPPTPPQHQPPPPPPPHHSVHRASQDIDEMKSLFSLLSTEVESLKSSIKELATTIGQQNRAQPAPSGSQARDEDPRKKAKILRQREKRAAKLAERRAANMESKKILNQEKAPELNDDGGDENPSHQPVVTNAKYNRRTNRERNNDKRRIPRREFKDKEATSRTLPKVKANANDDSTTQAADPSSEDRPEGDDGREGSAKERVRVFRRKKPHFNRRGPYGNRRRRADSSERNSNDTSPQNEANGESYQHSKKPNATKKTFPELSESDMFKVVQDLKREFLGTEKTTKSIKETLNNKGPAVANEFASSILDHAICDVTSPGKLSEIANNLYHLLISEDNSSEVDFQLAFYNALNDVSKRENDIAIDAPRYMDTLGQVLAECLVPMVVRHKQLVKKFLKQSVESYRQENRAELLASIMRGTAGVKDDRFAKSIWDIADLAWENFLNEGEDLADFLESHDVKFTTQVFSPEPQKSKKTPEELEKFADDVTSLVEKRCSPQQLDDLITELDIQPDERISYMGTLIYAIFRGCILVDSGDYKLKLDALSKYTSIMTAQREDRDAMALHALSALTKLWHQYNCPQDLMKVILATLHSQEIASYGALKNWLYSENLNNIPGIGAARLSCKRYIEDLGK